MDEREIPFMHHLHDLRSCIIRGLAGLACGMACCYALSNWIMDLLKRPMLEVMGDDSKFVVLSPQEYFFTELKASMFFGLILSSPWIFFQVWRFVAPGLYKNERKILFYFILSASTCFLLGVLFSYFLVFPATFKFFVDTLPPGVLGSYSISMLYGFAITVLLAFGIMFQMPVVVFLLVMWDFVSIGTLAQYRKVALVITFILGALLTPPDPITQVLLALPTYALFELGLFFAQLALKKREREIGYKS